MGELLRGAAEALRASGSDTARLDAELLLAHLLRVDRTALLAAPGAPVGADHAAEFARLVERRAAGEPVAYIRGLKEFYGLVFSVDQRALIPRPETELLVELGLENLRRRLVGQPRPMGGEPLVVWDVGTGSGAVCIALAVEARRRGYGAEVRFLATDISAESLALATENAVAHAVADVIEFAVADLTEVPGTRAADLLVANLPYIPSAIVPVLPVAASYEPSGALDGGPDGLGVIRRVLPQLERAVVPGGVALLEIGADQADRIRTAAAAEGAGWQVTIHDDLSGQPRVAELVRIP